MPHSGHNSTYQTVRIPGASSLTGQLATVTAGVTVPTVSGYQATGTTSYTYDANDRLAAVVYPNGQYIQYAYDDVGNMIGRSTADGSWGYGYDANQHLTSVTDPGKKITNYGYDANNNLSQTVYPDGTQGLKEYDNNGNLLQVAWMSGQGALLNGAAYALLPNGQRQTVTRYDGNSTVNVASLSYTNPATNITTTQQHWSLSNPAMQASYIYDYAQRLTQEQVQDYRNNLQRVTSWMYDAAGNRISQTEVVTPATGVSSTTSTTYTYDATDQLLQATTTTPTGSTLVTGYSWDQKGRLIQKATPSQVTLYSWRSDDRLVQVSQGATAASAQVIATYSYDDNGNRIERITQVADPTNPSGSTLVPQVTDYLVDEAYAYPETLEEVQSADTATTRTQYTWGAGLVSASADNGGPNGPSLSYYESDGLGSIMTRTGLQGSALANYRYDAFGRTYGAATTDANPYRYTGEYTDAVTGLQYNRARWYDSSLGRFISMDSFEGGIQDPSSLNHFVYAENDSINRVDPSGFASPAANMMNLVVGFAVQGILDSMATFNSTIVFSEAVLDLIAVAQVGNNSDVSTNSAVGEIVEAQIAKCEQAAERGDEDDPACSEPYNIIFYGARHDELTNHVAAAQAAGYPVELHRVATGTNSRDWLETAPECANNSVDRHCDEYPFASTAEGGANAPRRPSLFVIDGWDNTSGGAILGVFYRGCKVADDGAAGSLFSVYANVNLPFSGWICKDAGKFRVYGGQ